jgi:hypothetical protein
MDTSEDITIVYCCLLSLIEEMGGLVRISKSSILEIAESKNKRIGVFIDDTDEVILEVIDNDQD